VSILRYKIDRTPVIIFTALALLDLAIYLLNSSLIFNIVYLSLMIPVKACICAWNHHHQHVQTFRNNLYNRFLDLIYALHTGITGHAWVLHHNLGHHVNYRDQSLDESGWQRKDGTKMGAFEYTVRLAATGYFCALKVGTKYTNHLKIFLIMFVITLSVVVGLVIYNPVSALFVYLIPMLSGYIITCWHTYYHHSGLESEDHFSSSYNIMHKWYNILTGNLGYHTAHHYKPGVHWSLLPELHAKIKDQIPQELFLPPCFPFTLLPEK
jgi:fatty acid desaturase